MCNSGHIPAIPSLIMLMSPVARVVVIIVDVADEGASQLIVERRVGTNLIFFIILRVTPSPVERNSSYRRAACFHQNHARACNRCCLFTRQSTLDDVMNITTAGDVTPHRECWRT